MRRALIAMVGLASLPTDAAVVAFVAWWVLVSAEMPGRTWVRRALVGLLAVYATTAAALSTLAVLELPCEPRTLLGVLLAGALLWQVRRPDRDAVPVGDIADALALTMGVVTLAMLGAPVLGASTAEVMALLSQGTDGATHVQLVAAMDRYDGYVHLVEPAGLSPGAEHYPTGWHGTVWLVSSLLGTDDSVRGTVLATALAAVAGYALASTVAALVAVRLPLERVSLRRAAAIVVSLALSTLFGFGTLLLQLASFTQVAALAAMLTLLAVTDEVAGAPVRGLVAAGACAIAVMQSWYLLALLVAVVVGTVLARFRAERTLLVVATLVVTPFCAYPLLTGPGSGQVDLGGPVLLPTLVGVLGLLLATAVACADQLRSGGGPLAVPVVASFVAALGTFLVLVLREGFGPRASIPYYGAKVLLTALLLAVVLASAHVGAHLGRSRRGTATAVAALTGMALATWSTAERTLPPTMSTERARPSTAILQAVLERHPEELPAGTDVVVLDGCSRSADRIATKWAYDAVLGWHEGYSDVLAEHAAGNKGDVSALRDHLADSDVKTLEVFVHQLCDPAALAQLEREPKAQVIRVP